MLPEPQPDPDPAGSGIGLNEFEFPSVSFPLAVTTQFVTLPTIYVPCRIKTLMIVSVGTITHTAGQVLVQLYAARTAKTGVRTGAASQVTGADEGLIGATANWGPNAGTLANQAWFFSPQQLPELQWEYPWLGLEINFTAAPSQGSLTIAALYGAPL